MSLLTDSLDNQSQTMKSSCKNWIEEKVTKVDLQSVSKAKLAENNNNS